MNIFSQNRLKFVALVTIPLLLTFFAGFEFGQRSNMLAAVFTADPGPFTLNQPSVTCQNNLPVVSLSWTESTNTDRYSIQRKVGSDTSATGFSGEIMSQIRATSADDTLFVSTYGRTAHSYRIIAKGNAHTYSNAMTIVLPECKNTASTPPAPAPVPPPPAPTPTPTPTPEPTPTPSPVPPPPTPTPSPTPTPVPPPPPPAPVNVVPTATLSIPTWAVTSLYLGSSISFQGVGRDTDGSIMGYEWRDGNCATGELLSTLSQFTKSNFAVGSHTIFFNVKDDKDAWSTNCPSRIVTIAQPKNVIPTATIQAPTGNISALKSANVIFTGVGTDSDGSIAGYEWLENSCSAGALLSSAASFSKSDFAIGAHTVYLRVKDNAGAWSTNCPSRIITIQSANALPTASILAPSLAVTLATLGASVAMVGNGADTDGSIAGYEWREGSCTAGTLLSSLASFAKSDFTLGDHVVYFRVKDNAGAWSTNCPTRTFSITPPPTTQTKFPSWMTWGASVGWQDTAMSNFESVVGKSPQMEAIFSHWGNQTFPFEYSARIRDKGRTMIIFWEAVDYNRPYFSQPEYSFDAVNNGSLDAFFTKYAQDAKTYGGPIILVPYSEFNGDWFPWGMTVQGNTPAKFIAAWIRMRNIFNTVGATNVKFAWVPNNDAVPDTAANKFELNYPGAQYVDYVGLDGFNSTPWETFDQMFGGELARLNQYNKPIYIFSLGVKADTRKAQWITDTFTRSLYQYPGVKGWVWFNENKEQDWRVNSSTDSLAAFKAMLP